MGLDIQGQFRGEIVLMFCSSGMILPLSLLLVVTAMTSIVIIETNIHYSALDNLCSALVLIVHISTIHVAAIQFASDTVGRV